MKLARSFRIRIGYKCHWRQCLVLFYQWHYSPKKCIGGGSDDYFPSRIMVRVGIGWRSLWSHRCCYWASPWGGVRGLGPPSDTSPARFSEDRCHAWLGPRRGPGQGRSTLASRLGVRARRWCSEDTASPLKWWSKKYTLWPGFDVRYSDTHRSRRWKVHYYMIWQKKTIFIVAINIYPRNASRHSRHYLQWLRSE